MAVFRTVKNENYTVMCNHHLTNKSLSLKAKGLLSLILALPDNWNYNTRGLASCSKDGVDSTGNALKELEQQGYIIRRQLRGSDGRIYDTEYTVYEIPQKKSPDPDAPDTGNPDVVEPVPEVPDSDNPPVLNTKKPNTKKSNTEQSSTHSFCPDFPPESPLSDGRNERQRIREQIEYSCLAERYDRRQLDEIVELVLEVSMNRSPTIKIGRDAEYPSEYVRERFSRLNALHIERVMDGIADNCTQVRNTKAYLLAIRNPRKIQPLKKNEDIERSRKTPHKIVSTDFILIDYPISANS